MNTKHKNTDIPTQHVMRTNVVELAVFAVILGISITTANLFQQVMVGEFVICFYGLIAFIRQSSSVTAFKMTIILFLFIPFISTIPDGNNLADTFAVYALLLAIIGSILLGAEYWREHHHNNTKWIKIYFVGIIRRIKR